MRDAPPASTYVKGPRGEPAGPELGRMRFGPGLCSAGERRPGGELLDVGDFVQFLRARGASPKVAVQRGDLTIVEASLGAERPVRFRVAVLPSAEAAGQELHKTLLEHGLGAWGVRRSNLAVLVASPAPLDDIVVFTATTKLACWGALNVAGHDDVFVVPGAHFEL
ncbi:MAG TPA: hypothetical protein VFS00_28975 [Polyangiaceae bacterium]|nr:hypothetical protein [Polyangiaceae bacterium]